ncbi:MAG: hypothetical protein ACRDJ1_04080 [Actinomycetota bacterium]
MPAKRKPARRTTSRSRPASARRSTPKRAAPKRAAPKRAAPKRAAPKRAAPKTAPSRKAASKKTKTRAATPKRSAPKRATRSTPRRATSRRATSSRERLRTRGRTPPAAQTPRPAEPEPRPSESWPEEEFRPVVRGETTTFVDVAAAPVPAWGEQASAEPERAKEVYGEDIPIAIVSVALAVSAFLPWYKGQGGFEASVSAWASGTWGPIIFFLGLGSLALLILRRAGVRLSLPFEESLLHELAGWVALAGGVIKSRYRPGPEGVLGISWGLWVGLGAAFALAFLAGRMAPHAPLVRRPRWYRERGGAVAAIVLLVVVAGSSVFGTINKTEPLSSIQDPGTIPGLVRGRLPDCAAGFPIPSIVRPVQGVEQPCQAHLQSDRPAAEVVTAMQQALTQAGWTVTVGETGGTTTLNITAPKCATAAIVGATQGSVSVVAFGICASASPTPRATSS